MVETFTHKYGQLSVGSKGSSPKYEAFVRYSDYEALRVELEQVKQTLAVRDHESDFLKRRGDKAVKRAEENNDHKTGLRRMWINQPSTLQTLHKLHGELVLAAPDAEGTHRVYFVRGSIVSMQVPYHVLSAGWPIRHLPPAGQVEPVTGLRDIDAILQPLDDIYVRDGFCDWADVANARDEIRATLTGAKP